MTKHVLVCQPRKITGRKVKTLRRQGIIPANLFGKNQKSVDLQVDHKQFQTAFTKVGESSLLYLQVEGEKETRPVFVSQVTPHPVTDQVLHVVFRQVDLKEKVTAPVPVLLTGEAPAEKDKLGILVQQTNEVEVEALPADMPENITLDVSGLTEVDASLTVADIKTKATYKILTDADTIIVKIEPLAAEEKEEAPAPAEVPEGEAVPAEGAPAEGETQAGQPPVPSPAEEKPE